MNKSGKITAIITAGGISQRFGSNKLLEKIGKYSVIETTILKFLDKVDEIIIPTTDETKEFILKSPICNDKIKFASAGATRQKSVYNALLECKNCDIVLIHDGARPYISSKTIDEAIKLTKENKAVIVGKMAVDTIKFVENDKIKKTIDRSKIFHAQTPQCFEYRLIKELHEKYKTKADFTDDSALLEAEGIEPVALIAQGNNDKITLKEDIKQIIF